MSRPYERTFAVATLGVKGMPNSPPPSFARDSRVVPVLEPSQRRNKVERSGDGPNAAQLSQNPADRCRALESPPTRLDRPHRPANLLARETQALGQSGLLVGPRINPTRPIVALDPARQPNSKVALPVVHQDQPIVCHGPKLH